MEYKYRWLLNVKRKVSVIKHSPEKYKVKPERITGGKNKLKPRWGFCYIVQVAFCLVDYSVLGS